MAQQTPASAQVIVTTKHESPTSVLGGRDRRINHHASCVQLVKFPVSFPFVMGVLTMTHTGSSKACSTQLGTRLPL